MDLKLLLLAGTAASLVGGSAAIAADAQAKKPAAAASAPPIATYWMDVSTQSGMGGMMAGGKPSMGDMMAMMSGGGPSYVHSLRLRLASRTPAPAAPKADHLIPPTMRMGTSLPLIAPQRGTSEPPGRADPKGKLTIYWGCGEHVTAGQPLVLDFAQLASGKVPESIKQAARAMGRQQHSYSGPTSAPGYGEWPNRDARPLPQDASLVGAHQVVGNYSPPISFALAAGQDFMAPMTLGSGGALPSGAKTVRWNAVPSATGYALAMFGGTQGGDVIMWSSVKTSGFANLDYLAPRDVTRAITAGDALPPSTTQCTIPAEVMQAAPMGMTMSVAYGPEVYFAEAPKNPKWAVTVRYKSNGSLIQGMEGAKGEGNAGPQQPPKKKKRGLGGLIGDVLSN